MTYEIKVDEIPETDKYDHKAMLQRINELYRCPKDYAFLKWKDEKKKNAVCPKCGFEREIKRE